MPTVTTTAVVGPEGRDALQCPRDAFVAERADGQGRFVLDVGPMHHWERSLQISDLGNDHYSVTETIHYAMAIPLWWPLFILPIRAIVRREHRLLLKGNPVTQPFWAPAERFDARASTVLALVCALSLATGYVGTAITQAITYAASEFGRSTGAQGETLAAVRIGVLLAFAISAAADRHGRRRLMVGATYAACLTGALGAVVPDLWALGVTQGLGQGFSTAATLLFAVVVAEEVPAGSRAWSVSIMAGTTALGAGVCLWVLPIADVGLAWWRVVFVVPLLGLPLVRWVSRQLPESGRFRAHHDADLVGREPKRRSLIGEHRRRFLLLAIGAFGIALFIAPAFQLQNEFLRHERGYSAARISLYTLVTSTPGGLGVVFGGWLADVRGRRMVAAIGIVGGTAFAVATLFAYGAMMWGLSLVGSIVGGLSIPALAVYGPELFPTLLRGRINGLLRVVAVAGSSAGLLLGGWFTDAFGRFGTAMSVLAIGPLLVAVVVLVFYPETSGLSLEELNPEDRPTTPSPP